MQHAYQVFFQNNDEDEAMAKYSDVRNEGQICMWNDSGLNYGVWGYAPPGKFLVFIPQKVINEAVLRRPLKPFLNTVHRLVCCNCACVLYVAGIKFQGTLCPLSSKRNPAHVQICVL